MTYTDDDITEMARSLRLWRTRADDLRIAYLFVPMRIEVSRAYAHHGLLRRLNSIDWSIDRVFNVIPPSEVAPTRDALIEAGNVLQAFIMNIVGALDNLARVWCLESDARNAQGEIIPDAHIGLSPENRSVRASLSPAYRERLRELDGWFSYLKNYRDAFAHRVPLYVPPRVLRPDDEPEYRALEAEKANAHNNREYQRWNELNVQQDALGRFEPWMMHSFGSDDRDGRPVRFHAQTVCDFAAVVELGELMLAELRRIGAD